MPCWNGYDWAPILTESLRWIENDLWSLKFEFMLFQFSGIKVI